MNLIASLVLALTLPFGTGATVQSGPVQATFYTLDGRKAPATQPQTLTTTIQDPKNPGEPWVVTSYQKDDESIEAFILRHKALCDAVRQALG